MKVSDCILSIGACPIIATSDNPYFTLQVFFVSLKGTPIEDARVQYYPHSTWLGWLKWFVARHPTGSGVACIFRPQLCNINYVHCPNRWQYMEYNYIAQAIALKYVIGRL